MESIFDEWISFALVWIPFSAFIFIFTVVLWRSFSLSVLFTCPPSGMKWAWPYIDGLVLLLDIKCLIEHVDDCSVPSINICWISIYNQSASRRWRMIWCYQWCIDFILTSSWNYLDAVLLSLNYLAALIFFSFPSVLYNDSR